jgi:hypothetical protein
MYRWASDKDQKQYCGMFVNPHLIAISQSEGALEQAVAAIQRSPAADGEERPFQLIAGAPEGAFVVACAEGLDKLTQDNEHAAILQNARVLAFIGHEEVGQVTLAVHLETRDRKAAQQVKKMAQGLLAFASLQEQKHPDLIPLLESLELSAEDNRVRLTFRYPAAALYDMVVKNVKTKVHESLDSLPR